VVKQKILVAGSGGMMGSHAVDYLINNYGNEFEVYGVDDLSGCYKENINPKSKFTKIDLRDVKAVKKYFKNNFGKTGIDYVVHYASAAHEIRSFFTPIDNMSRNDEAFRNVVTFALKHKVKHIVFFSSMSRYGSGVVKDGNGKIVINQKAPFRESYLPAPEDPYACSKVASENLLHALQNVFDFTYTIWIPHNCFSPRQYVDPYRNVLAIWMNLVLLGKECVIYGTGEQQRAISWVDDFNPVICKSIMDPKTYGQAFNIGGDENKSLNEWYDIIREVTGYDKESVHYDPRPGEVFNAYCKHDKAKLMLGFKNATPFKDAIAQMWEYFKKKGPRKFNYIDYLEIENEKVPVTWKKKLF